MIVAELNFGSRLKKLYEKEYEKNPELKKIANRNKQLIQQKLTTVNDNLGGKTLQKNQDTSNSFSKKVESKCEELLIKYFGKDR